MKSKIQKITFIISLIIIVFSCKKKEDVILTQPNPEVFNTDKINGRFELLKYQIATVYDTLQTLYYGASCLFSDTLVDINEFMYENGIDVGSVKLNNEVLKKYSSQNPNYYIYYDTTFTKQIGLIPWNVSGNANYIGFTRYVSSNFPIYSDCSNLPDTLDFSKSKFEVKFNGVSDADEIEVILDDLTNPRYSFSKKLKLPNVTAIFSYQEMQTIFPDYSGTPQLMVSIYKNNYELINGKVYNFRAVTNIQKLFILKI
jgi:hypothetical protein